MSFPLFLRSALVVCLGAASASANEEAALQADLEALFDRYNREVLQVPSDSMDEARITWLERQPLASAAYKATHAKLYRDALKADPEVGYGADALTCGQDYPDAGCRVERLTLSGTTGEALFVSRDPAHQHLFRARLTKHEGKWQLEGTEPVEPAEPAAK